MTIEPISNKPNNNHQTNTSKGSRITNPPPLNLTQQTTSEAITDTPSPSNPSDSNNSTPHGLVTSLTAPATTAESTVTTARAVRIPVQHTGG